MREIGECRLPWLADGAGGYALAFSHDAGDGIVRSRMTLTHTGRRWESWHFVPAAGQRYLSWAPDVEGVEASVLANLRVPVDDFPVVARPARRADAPPEQVMAEIASAAPDAVDDVAKVARVREWLATAAQWPRPKDDLGPMRDQFVACLQSHHRSGRVKPDDLDLMAAYAQACCDVLRIPYEPAPPRGPRP